VQRFDDSVLRQPASYSKMNLRHAAALALVGWYLMARLAVAHERRG
jgi:hypothetical protein